MQQKYKDSKFKEWLDILQQESWQLELIISGVAIFGLFQAFDPIRVWMSHFQSLSIENGLVRAVGVIALGSISLSLFALMSCLLIHIVLRGLWIGAVGLRYFSGDIDYDNLKYTDKFKKYLEKRTGSFDDYIGRLEDYCSIIFAISFLLVFFFISFFFTLIIILGISYIVGEMTTGHWSSYVVGPLFAVVLSLASLFTFLDFFTQGFFKKKKWLGYIYFPIYRVMSRVTFSFVYRPLLYNLLDNKLGKRIIALLIPGFVLLLILTGSGIVESNFHNKDWSFTEHYAKSSHYEDILQEEDYRFVDGASIPSKIIYKKALPVFVKHTTQIESAILEIDTLLKPNDDVRGFNFFKDTNFDFGGERDVTEDEFVKYTNLLPEVVKVSIDDTIPIPVPFTVATNIKEQLGYETVIDMSEQSRGLHTLYVNASYLNGDSLKTRSLAKIPFWYYPD